MTAIWLVLWVLVGDRVGPNFHLVHGDMLSMNNWWWALFICVALDLADHH